MLEFIISLIVAFIFALLLIFLFNRRGPGPGGGLLFLFLIIFMFAWVGGAWIEPVGPVLWGASWLVYVSIAFIIMLLLAALLLPTRPYRRKYGPSSSRVTSKDVEEEAETSAGLAFGTFFWILILVLLSLGLLGGYNSL